MEAAYEGGYEAGVSRWVSEMRDLPPKERDKYSMIALLSAVNAFMIETTGLSAQDFACGFAQAIVDKETCYARSMGERRPSFCVSNYAFVLSTMAKSVIVKP